VKDIGAMCVHGGYLAIGADDHGAVTGLPAGQAALLDPSPLNAKIAKYLDGVRVTSAVHAVKDAAGVEREVALVFVPPHPDGFAIFKQDGKHGDGRDAKGVFQFRRGSVYVRHGSDSEVWVQSDVDVVRRRLVAMEKDRWRRELAADLDVVLPAATTAQSVAAGPSALYSWQLDNRGFEQATVELIRRDDDVPVRQMLRAASGEVRRLIEQDARALDDDVPTLLDRIASVATLGIDLERVRFADLALAALFELYDWSVGLEVRVALQERAGVLVLRIAERLYAIGSLAVRRQAWQQVRELVLRPVPALASARRSHTWHRHALTEAATASLLDQKDGQPPISLLLFARSAAAKVPSLRPDLVGDVPEQLSRVDPLLSSLCQFDLLVTVLSGVAVNAADKTTLLGVSYPNYARADGERANGIVPTLLFDLAAKAALLPCVNDRVIARVLYIADEVAQKEAFRYWGWEGYTDAGVMEFIRQSLPA